MTQKQWDDHSMHLNDHITWPANKQAILDACEGSDVEPAVLEEIKNTLTDGDRQYSQAEFKEMMVKPG